MHILCNVCQAEQNLIQKSEAENEGNEKEKRYSSVQLQLFFLPLHPD